MAKVNIEFLNVKAAVIDEETILTTADSTYVFDDISNWMHADYEFSKVPKGTKEILIRIECDF